MPSKILVIEDQKAMAMLLKARIEDSFAVEVLVAHDLQQARQILADHPSGLCTALCDLNLPDAPNGESVALVRKAGLTPIVLTANYDEKVRERMYQERVADFVLKEGSAAIEYVLRVLKLLIANENRLVWLANLNDKMVIKLSGLLSVHRFKVQVFDQVKSLSRELQEVQPDLLIVGDADLSNEWLYQISDIRTKHKFFELPIIACISEHEGESLALKYMKYGANDFIVRPFSAEAFYARVNQSIEQQLAYLEIERISRTDALSELYNRRYCLEQGTKLFNRWRQSDALAFAVLIDIDLFKRINDRYGHPKGDEAIKFTATQLKQHFSDFLVARFGGEEFIVLGSVESKYELLAQAEAFRNAIEQESEPQVGVHFTTSIGIAFEGETLEQMIALADQKLYQAKDKGRNQVCHSFGDETQA
jgi:diguanylate cyclase (GGDEF)-like protein